MNLPSLFILCISLPMLSTVFLSQFCIYKKEKKKNTHSVKKKKKKGGNYETSVHLVYWLLVRTKDQGPTELRIWF